jgi:hypothetical protein
MTSYARRVTAVRRQGSPRFLHTSISAPATVIDSGPAHGTRPLRAVCCSVPGRAPGPPATKGDLGVQSLHLRCSRRSPYPQLHRTRDRRRCGIGVGRGASPYPSRTATGKKCQTSPGARSDPLNHSFGLIAKSGYSYKFSNQLTYIARMSHARRAIATAGSLSAGHDSSGRTKTFPGKFEAVPVEVYDRLRLSLALKFGMLDSRLRVHQVSSGMTGQAGRLRSQYPAQCL